MTPDKRTSLDCEPNAVGPATGRVAGSRLPLCSLLLCMLALGPAAAAAQETGDELRCELGEVSSIEVRNGSVFDEMQSDSRLLRWGLSAANTLHMRTRATFIRDELLFKSGDCIDPIRVRESERLLEAYPTLRDVQILESSGEQVLDQAAMRIVRLAAPFMPFTGDLMDIDVLEIIRTWRFEPGDRVSSF